MNADQKVVLRDAVTFAVKLWLDGLKDVALAFAGLGAAGIDLFRGKPTRNGWLFYRVMHYGEKVDRALDLYGSKLGPGENDTAYGYARADQDGGR
jgi:hypothetical protein